MNALSLQAQVLRAIFCAILLGISLLYGNTSEDAALLRGADSLYHRDFATSFDEFIVLFDETKEPYYAKLAAQAAIGKGDLESALRLAELYAKLSGDYDDVVINKILADGYAQQGQIVQAIQVLERLYKRESTKEVAEVLANTYMLNHQAPKAQPLYATLYAQSHDIELLKKLLISLALQDKRQEALGVLSGHLLEFGCDDQFCEESARFYEDLQGLDMAKDVFEKIYKKNPTIPNATNFMRVLIALKDYQEAQGVAKAFPFDKGLLLDLYVMQGDFAKAQKEAAKTYEQSRNPRFLALEGVYEFSALESPKRESAQSSASKLSRAITEREKELADSSEKPTSQDAFFYNFYGYLLIDYELDIAKGIESVKKALAIEPYAIAYIDSLAWGYYKLGECENALKTFAQIPKDQVEKEDELRAHRYQILGVCQKVDSRLDGKGAGKIDSRGKGESASKGKGKGNSNGVGKGVGKKAAPTKRDTPSTPPRTAPEKPSPRPATTPHSPTPKGAQ